MSNWISVEEKLPERSGDVLCCVDTTDMVVLEYFDSFKQFFDRDGDNTGRVTHWQYLPEPPESSND